MAFLYLRSLYQGHVHRGQQLDISNNPYPSVGEEFVLKMGALCNSFLKILYRQVRRGPDRINLRLCDDIKSTLQIL